MEKNSHSFSRNWRNPPSKAREGDFIETAEGLIFDVKGLVHPLGRIIAFLRYFPDPRGNRERGGLRYRKVYSIADKYRVLKKMRPQYIAYDHVFDEYLNEVPVGAVVCCYKPQDKLAELQRKPHLDEVERQTLEFIELLRESSGASWEKFGISGSVLVGLHIATSDIDPIVYGTRNCLLVRDALRKLLTEGGDVKPYDIEGLKKLYEFRVKDTLMPFKNFVWHERRKTFQGTFKGRDFFIRYVKGWNEIVKQYGDVTYTSLGFAKIKARVIDDSESMFTPCHYWIRNVEVLEGPEVSPIKEVTSFRGRFCEHAKTGEVIFAQGKLEKVSKKGKRYYRLLLGSKPSHYMITINTSS